MTFRKLDMAWETTSPAGAVGTGALSLVGAQSNKHVTFATAGMTNGDTCDIRIEHTSAGVAEWEECLATWGTGNILTRSTLKRSSTGSRVSFSAGALNVWSPLFATRAVSMDPNGDAAITRDLAVGRNATVAGTLGVTGAASAARYDLAGVTALVRSGDYTVFYDGDAINVLQLGKAADPTNYHGNTTHKFYGRGYGTLFATLNATGLGLGGDPAVQFDMLSNVNVAMTMRHRNASTGASSSSVFRQDAGSRYVDRSIFYTGQAMSETGVGITSKYTDFDNHFFRTNAGAEIAALSTGALRPGVDTGPTLGHSSFRWNTVYALTGSINTSMRSEKSAIKYFRGANLDDASDTMAKLLRVGARMLKLVTAHQWKEAVEKKGEQAARFHVNYIFDDVVAACEAEGLDPYRQAFVCQDAKVITEEYFEDRERPVMEDVPGEGFEVIVTDGVPRLMPRQTAQRPKTVSRPVIDSDGKPVECVVGQEPTGLLDGSGQAITRPIIAPMMHDVPVMEPYKVKRTRQVAATDEAGNPVYIDGLRTDQLDRLCMAALATGVTVDEA